MSSVTAIAPWFGSNRMLAKHVGAALRGCNWVGVPFAGGMSEVAHIEARTINVNDLHRHVINLARVMADKRLGPVVYRKLRRLLFHPAQLSNAQEGCAEFWSIDPDQQISDEQKVAWATEYFVAAWMPRHSSSGTKNEFSGGISTRWNAGGGDSAAHYQGAIRAMNDWRRILRKCNFTTLDFRHFLAKCKDEPGHGIYSDPPFFGPGDKYAFRFTEQDHRELSVLHGAFRAARVVVRYYDVPLVRELYPESHWKWQLLEGRKQTNGAAPEVLITNLKSCF